jgi:putative PIG3 family NAD(P)H quinone oxidoreductase
MDAMKAVMIEGYGGPEVLTLTDTAEPRPGPEDILVRVRAVGVNRADCLQRAGTYPVPPGMRFSSVPGLELAGEVVEVGPAVTGFETGQRVFGLVSGGAYAEYALIDQGLAVPMPEHWEFCEGAAVIEVYCTANETVFELGRLAGGQTVLIHAGASGVGTAAIQMAKHIGATAFFTAGSQAKIERVLALGGDRGILYRSQDFLEEALRATGGEGVDMIEDFIGADYLARNLGALKEGGRLVLVGLMGGASCDIGLGILLRKRLSIHGFTLRAQSLANKRAIVTRFRERWLPPLAEGRVKPIIDTTLPLAEVRRAHELMEADQNIGKILLTVD